MGKSLQENLGIGVRVTKKRTKKSGQNDDLHALTLDGATIIGVAVSWNLWTSFYIQLVKSDKIIGKTQNFFFS